MILEVETPECTGHNFRVTVVATGRVPQIKNSPRVSSIFERKFSDEQQIKLPKMSDLKLTADSYWKFQPKMTKILFWKSLRSRCENATPNLCRVFCALLGILCN